MPVERWPRAGRERMAYPVLQCPARSAPFRKKAGKVLLGRHLRLDTRPFASDVIRYAPAAQVRVWRGATEAIMRLTGKLSAKKVAKLLSKGEPGNWHDGQGLRLEIRSANSGSWVSRYEMNGRERWMGLGPARLFTLAEARERNRRARQKLVDGIDPLDERRAERAAALAAAKRTVTFTEAAEAYIAGNAAKWRNPKHGAQWAATLKTYAFPTLGALSVSDIDVPLILKVLEQHVPTEPAGPFWSTRGETASRVRGRIEMILDWATARGLRTGDNPAAWKTIGKVLPARGGKKVVHHAALPYAELPVFVAALAKREGVAAKALLFTILTAARSGESLGARWSEIDLAKKTWTVPAARMKAHVEHAVPLSPAALDLLAALPREAGNDCLFIGRQAARGLAHDAMNDELAALGRRGLTVHGFRSSFRDWAAEQTAFAHDVVETALAHSIGDASERAYRRTKQLPRRRELMNLWARFCMSPPAIAGNNVVAMGGGHA
jgi:integrase